MKKGLMLFLFFTLPSCGTLRLNPKSCKSNGVWGATPSATRERTAQAIEDENAIDIRTKETYYVFADKDVKISEMLAKHGLKCEDIKKMRVEVETSWWIKREVTIKVVRN